MVRILMLLCISKTNKKCVEHRPQATLVDGVDLDEVLFDVRGFPLSQENWREFLENQHADEVCACGLTTFTKKTNICSRTWDSGSTLRRIWRTYLAGNGCITARR